MTHKEIIEKAITELNEMERPHKGELLPAWWVLDKILKHVDKALSLLEQPEPPEGEFTKKYRESLRYCTNTITEGYEACRHIDAQQQEIERLQSTNRIQSNRMKEQHEYIEAQRNAIDRLTAENKAQAERIERLITALKFIGIYKEQPAFYDSDALAEIAMNAINADRLREQEKKQALKGDKP